MEDAAFRELDVGRAGVCAEDSVGVEGGVVGDPNVVNAAVGAGEGAGMEGGVVGDPNVVDTVVGGVDGVGLEGGVVSFAAGLGAGGSDQSDFLEDFVSLSPYLIDAREDKARKLMESNQRSNDQLQMETERDRLRESAENGCASDCN